jgi:hypothetical protein
MCFSVDVITICVGGSAESVDTTYNVSTTNTILIQVGMNMIGVSLGRLRYVQGGTIFASSLVPDSSKGTFLLALSLNDSAVFRRRSKTSLLETIHHQDVGNTEKEINLGKQT